MTIRWPQPSRLIPLAAQSIRIEARNSSGEVVRTQVVSRPPIGDISRVTLSTLPSGTLSVNATAFPSSDGTGTAQATGVVSVSVKANQTASATVTMGSTIARVSINDNEGTPLIIGQTRTLTAQAFNSLGETVLVDPTQWEWINKNTNNLNAIPSGADITLTAINPGETTISLRDKESGKTSEIKIQSVFPSLNTTKIAFVTSPENNNPEIYTMDIDGSNRQRLTYNNGEDIYPIWSPDAKKIAFFSYRNGFYDIYIMNSDGTDQINITNHEEIFYDRPSWSPDGKKILYHSGANFGSKLVTINLDGTDRKEIPGKIKGGYHFPTWSPDGKKIAFNSWGGQTYSVYIAGVDGSYEVQVTPVLESYSGPAWSPNNSTLAFSRTYSKRNGICTTSSYGSEPDSITFDSDYYPWWSPDGKKIIFYSTQGDTSQHGLYIMNPDGSNQTKIPGTSADTTPCWSPFPK